MCAMLILVPLRFLTEDLLTEVFLNLTEVFLNLTEVLRAFSSVVRQMPR
jgi:hypothetical protein